MAQKVYILAVSGGVDSVVLLHKLMSLKPPHVTYVVAHFNHGIREDASQDEAFVAELANKYGLTYESIRVQLGKGASEEQAREARYDFLFSVLRQYKAEGIVTAHHEDDALETMVSNIFRGASRLGIIGYSRERIVRPFMNKTKQELLDYAQQHQLEWREDSTNTNQTYMRNYIRLSIIPKLGDKREELLLIRAHLMTLQQEIEKLTKNILVQTLKKQSLVRADFVVLPYIVQLEVMAMWLRLNGIPFDKKTVVRATSAAKTLSPNKYIELPRGSTLHAQKKIVVLKVAHSDV